MVHCARAMVHHTRAMVHRIRAMVRRTRAMVRRTRVMVHRTPLGFDLTRQGPSVCWDKPVCLLFQDRLFHTGIYSSKCID